MEETRYTIHNTVRGRTNRTLRATSPAHLRLKQYVLPQQLRLVRGRPVVITEKQLLDSLEELKKKNKAGILEVRTQAGQRLVDLDKVLRAVPEEALGPEAASPRPVEPVVPVDEMQHIGKDFIPPFEGVEQDTTGPDIPIEGMASGTSGDESTIETLGIPPALPVAQATAPEDGGEEEYRPGGRQKQKQKPQRR